MTLLVVLGLVFALGCGSTIMPRMDSGKGEMTVNAALAKWGTPIHQRKTADGGTEMVWRSENARAARREYVHPRGPTYGGTARSRAEVLVASFDRKGVLKKLESMP